VLALLAAGAAAAVAADTPQVRIPRVDAPLKLEDFLDMRPPAALEGRLAHVTGFIQREPEDGKPASQRTDVWLGYDREKLYLVFCAFDEEPERMRASMARRENVFGDEIVEVQLDTFNAQRRAYSFVANPYGVQWDAIWTEGNGFDSSWDTLWQSRGRITDRGYVVSMEIPFKSLRFPQDAEQIWRVVFVRDIPRNNESSFWPQVSSRIEGRLNQAAELTGLGEISPGRNIQLIPYATARNIEIVERPQEGQPPDVVEDELDPDVGLDAKFVFQDRVALDLTANPDFSQVESDEPQVTVNQRFEVFFPEKRPFFLENADLFNTRFNLLFTRRIADPRVGARVTGKLGAWAVGGLVMDDEAPGKVVDDDNPLEGERARFDVLRLRRDVSQQSSVGVLFTNRRFDGEYNQVAGVDGRFKLDDNWDVWFHGVHSKTRRPDGTALEGPALSLDFNRNGRHYETHIHHRYVGEEFRTDTGFVPRVDIRDSHTRQSYTFRPEGKRLIEWGPRLFLQYIDDHDGVRLDRRAELEWEWEFRRQTEFGIVIEQGRERLRPGDVEGLTTTLDFSTSRYALFAESRFINAVAAQVRFEIGRGINFSPPKPDPADPSTFVPPFAADREKAEVELTLRPLRRLRIDNTYLYTRLDDRQGRGEIFTNEIFRTRFNWQFDPRLSLRVILRYETTRPDPALSSLDDDDSVNGDLLVTYLVNPWTALYVGYNGNYRNFDIVDDVVTGPVLERTSELDLNDAEQYFVKLSYLLRF
jgi:hypothetical protein